MRGKSIGSTALMVPLVARELAEADAAEARRQRLEVEMAGARTLSDDALGFLWYAEPKSRGVIECVRWERAAARGVLA